MVIVAALSDDRTGEKGGRGKEAGRSGKEDICRKVEERRKKVVKVTCCGW
jgi:hypothetical protein